MELNDSSFTHIHKKPFELIIERLCFYIKIRGISIAFAKSGFGEGRGFNNFNLSNCSDTAT